MIQVHKQFNLILPGTGTHFMVKCGALRVQLLEDSDKTVADLITDGCNMGVKTVHRYLNQYPAAEKKVRGIAEKLAGIEEKLAKDMRVYL